MKQVCAAVLVWGALSLAEASLSPLYGFVEVVKGPVVRTSPRLGVESLSPGRYPFQAYETLLLEKPARVKVIPQGGEPTWYESQAQLRVIWGRDERLVLENNGEIPKRSDAKPTGQKEVWRTKMEKAVFERLQTKAPQFQRCLTHYLKKHWSENASPQKPEGQVAFHFTIEPTGKVASPELLNSPFEDAEFHTCLSKVVSETRFQAFQGSPIATVFPISFL